jgi:hypothetical protein
MDAMRRAIMDAMTKRLKFLALMLFLPVALAACETPSPVQKLAGLSFSHLAPLRLNVAQVDVSSDYQARLKDPSVDHLFPTTPEAALRQWADDRLQPAGRGDRARFIITDAKAIETRLKRDTSLKGAFKKEQSERYDVTVAATVEIQDSRSVRLGFVETQASRSRTVPEDITLNGREKVWFELTEDVMKDFNALLEKNIRQHLGGFLF